MNKKTIETKPRSLFEAITIDDVLASLPPLEEAGDPVDDVSKSIILMHLPTDKNQAISSKDLRALTGLTFRELKSIITVLRYKYPICAKETKGGGYWLATDPADVKEFVDMIRRRKEGYEKTIEVMKSHLLEM